VSALRAIVALAFAGVVAGCGSLGGAKEDPLDVLPKDYRNEIKLLLQQTLDDPTNVKEAGITEPAINPALPIQRYYSCVKYNAREVGTRRYKGVVEKVAVYHEGRLNQLIEPPAGMCAKMAYKAFPEIEKMCLGTKCD